MKMNVIIALLLAASMSSCDTSTEKLPITNNNITSMDSVSYALGILFANNIKSEGLTDLNPTDLARGFEAVMDGSATMTPEEADGIVRSAMSVVQEAKSAVAEKDGVEFLAANASKDGIQVTESGLQYRHDVVGDGAAPDANDKVTVHYSGTLIDGTVFDSSYERGEPISFPLNGVIAGWTEGLQLMNVGGKTTFYIPQELAYGARPNPNGPIPPYAALVFVVELLEVSAVE